MSIVQKYGEWAPDDIDIPQTPDTLSWRYGDWAVIIGDVYQSGTILAQKVAERKMKVCLVDNLPLPQLQSLAAQLSQDNGVSCKALALDLTKASSSQRLIAQLKQDNIGLMSYAANDMLLNQTSGTSDLLQQYIMNYSEIVLHYYIQFQQQKRGIILQLNPKGTTKNVDVSTLFEAYSQILMNTFKNHNTFERVLIHYFTFHQKRDQENLNSLIEQILCPSILAEQA